MIAQLIRWSVHNRVLIMMGVLVLALWGGFAVRDTAVDALPDLSDVQVIIRTSFPGQAPGVVENQVTYPLTTLMMSVPGARVVRGYSFFGDSYVYVIFQDGTDLYWARSRVLEYLNQVQGKLPAAARPTLGPDATGVGWIYEYALVDRRGHHDLGELRALQDWFLKYELKSVPNVAEVASLGGMVREYQVIPDPARMAAYRVTAGQIVAALRHGNQEAGGSVVEQGEASYMVRATGYLESLEDFRQIPLQVSPSGTPVMLGDVARIRMGPALRQGIAELDGQGEVAGGVIVLRSGKNADEAIRAVRAKLESLKAGLPEGVEVVTTYDRSLLIQRALHTLEYKLAEEFVVVALVCGLFLGRWRSALVVMVSLPLGVLVALVAMHQQGINANIMSLGGVAIAVGAMVDAAVVMIENAHKKIEFWQREHPQRKLNGEERWRVVTEAAVEVGPSLFFSLLIIMFSFLPVLMLEAQEGRLFIPLAYTKSYAMAGAAALAVTLVPVLMGYWIRGPILPERSNPLNRWLIDLYQPLLTWALRHPWAVIGAGSLVLVSTVWPLKHLGGEFLPAMDEGTILYMPSAMPGLSAAKAAELLQQSDRLIRSVPEVARVFGKAGRAETATDPAPLEMFETTVSFKPRKSWRPGMTMPKLVSELDRVVRVPGLTNLWVPPIRNRLDMLATGIKSPVGVRVSTSSLSEMDSLTGQIERVALTVPGVASAFAEKEQEGRYIVVHVDRMAAARYGLGVADVDDVLTTLVGGAEVGEVVSGAARFPINVRYPREERNSIQALRHMPFMTPAGQWILLGDVASLDYEEGPSMIKTENARLVGWVYVDIQGRDMATGVRALQRAVEEKVRLPPGASVAYSGQFESMERARHRLKSVIPLTLLIIFALLYLIFRRLDEAALIMGTLPFALTGGVWLMYLRHDDLSVAVAVGFIALAGVAAEFGVIMLLYLRHALEAHALTEGAGAEKEQIMEAIREGAVMRVRPKAMTVSVILAGLLPVLAGGGTGSEIMGRMAAPMVGGMVTAPLLSLFILPAVYLLLKQRAIHSMDHQRKETT